MLHVFTNNLPSNPSSGSARCAFGKSRCKRPFSNIILNFFRFFAEKDILIGKMKPAPHAQENNGSKSIIYPGQHHYRQLLALTVAEALGEHHRREKENRQVGHAIPSGTHGGARNSPEHGIVPAPDQPKRTPWSTLLKSHCDWIAAVDLFMVEIRSCIGLTCCFAVIVYFVVVIRL